MARVVRFHKIGPPEVLQIEELDIGKPGPGEIRIRVEAIGINRAEAMFRSGTYLEQPRLPARLGYEASGIVESLGSGVKGHKVGDAIGVIPAFSMNQYATYAEHTIVPATAVVKRPVGVTPIESAAVWMAYLTAYGALIDIGKLTRGEAVVITAASSSVGLAAIQIANAIGAIPIAVTRTVAKRESLRHAGAPHVIVTEEQEIVTEVLRITEQRGARLVFDPVAGGGVETLAKTLTNCGILFVYGLLSGQPTPFPAPMAILKGLSFRGYILMEITSDPKRLATAVAFITCGLEARQLKPIIAKHFALDQIVESHRYLESNQQFGKIVVTVST